MIAKAFGVLEKVDETARAVAGVAVDLARGLAADVRRVKYVGTMARSLVREIGWSRMAELVSETLAERIGLMRVEEKEAGVR